MATPMPTVTTTRVYAEGEDITGPVANCRRPG